MNYPGTVPVYHRHLYCFLLLLCALSLSTKAQYYNLGQDPGNLKWRHIRNEHFDLIYPADFEVRAQHLMNLFSYVYENGTTTLGSSPRRVPVIIHNRDIVPNAFSVWAPRRIELYTCPPQNIYSQDWLEQLAIHEFRHVAQMEMVNHGFTRGLTWLLGEQATAAVTGLYIPMWFMEGDAVCTETALSHSGRGRVPSFEMEIRAQVMEKGTFSYNKAVLGSYKDHVPDQYILGYQLVANTRKNYGYKTWIRAFDEVARKPYMVTPLNHGLKKATGLNKTGLYKKTFVELDSLWKYQDRATPLTSRVLLTNISSSGFVRYKYPHYVGDSLIIAERTSLDDISRFVLIDRLGNEKVLCTPGFFSSEVFSINIGTGAKTANGNKPGSFTADNISLSHGLMAWTEREADPRWQNRSFSVIKIFDFGSGKIRSLTKRTRLFAPALAPDAKSILAVKMSEDNESSVVIIDINTGDETGTLLNSKADFYLTPAWSPDGKSIVYGILNEYGKSFHVLDVISGKSRQVLPPTFTEISNPVFAARFILFNGSYSGIENVYAIDTAGLQLYQVTSAPFGACDAEYHSSSNTLVYSDYSSSGYSLAETGFSPEKWKTLAQVTDFSPSLYKSLVKEESGVPDLTSKTDYAYESKPYRKITHLFNFHSWAPAYVNYNTSEAGAGISFMSQNALSTATTTAGYLWDYAEKTGSYRFNFTWEGWYPVVDAQASHGDRVAYAIRETDSSQFRYSWKETVLGGGLKLPLIFNQGKNYIGVTLSTHATYTALSENHSPDTIKHGFNTLDYRITFYRYIKQAVKDVYPRWGQSLDMNFRSSPFGNNDQGSQASIRTVLFMPGLLPHNGFKLTAGYQHREISKNSLYMNLIAMPRGNPAVVCKNLYSIGINYKFPFLYPDASLGSLLYFKRLKANLFYDHGFAYFPALKHYNSIGTEITSDLHILRFLLPLDMGVRVGYLPMQKKWFTDFLIAINLSI